VNATQGPGHGASPDESAAMLLLESSMEFQALRDVENPDEPVNDGYFEAQARHQVQRLVEAGWRAPTVQAGSETRPELRERIESAIVWARHDYDHNENLVISRAAAAEAAWSEVAPELERLTAEAERLQSLYDLAECQYAEQTGELKTDRDRYKAAHESTQRGLIRMEVQRDEACAEIKRLEENEEFLERAVHLALGCCDASDVPCEERDAEVLYGHVRNGTTPITQQALSGLLRGMAWRSTELRRSLRFADAHVPRWERIIGEHQAEIERLRTEHAQAVEDWGCNDEQLLAENQRLADQLTAAAALAADFRQRAEQTVATFGEEGQHDDECDSPAECHAVAQHFTWKLAARALEKALAAGASAKDGGDRG
jgi:hypothetical protein